MSRSVVAAMTAYTLQLREAEIKLNQNESPFDFPLELKEQVLSRMAQRAWNRYPDFESMALRTALANAYGLTADDILVGNGSNELLAAAIGAFVGPGTPVIFPRPTFALYEKLVTIAGGLPIPIDFDPDSGFLPLDEMLSAIRKYENAVVIVCSPNNPTGGVLPERGLQALLDSGAMVLLDEAYADFQSGGQAILPVPTDKIVCPPQNLVLPVPTDKIVCPPQNLVLPVPTDKIVCPPQSLVLPVPTDKIVCPPQNLVLPVRTDKIVCPPQNLVTFRTFSKAWGLAALRVGWLASSDEDCREIRKVKLPYSLNVISEAIAAVALDHPEIRDRNVARIVAERERMLAEMRSIPRIAVFPTQANFITFRTQRPLFEPLIGRGILVRDVSSYPRLQSCLRVSIGTGEQNDAFLAALQEVV